MACRKLSLPLMDGTVYQNEFMNTIEALLPAGNWKSAHAPALLETAGGDMLAVWFAGSFEGNTDVSIVFSRLEKGSDKWDEPQYLSNDPERSEQNPSLFLHPNGDIWVLYTSQLARQAGKDNMQYTSQVRRQISHDEGRTWSDYDVLFPAEGTFCRQPIQILSNGRWIISNWVCEDSPEGLKGNPTVFMISDDEGISWQRVDMPNSDGRVHANVVELENGHLVAFMRSRAADYVYKSESFDYGSSWCEPFPTVLCNNNSSISAVRLKSGRIAIACNPTQTDNPDPDGIAWPGLRCPVTVALSEDEGKSFPLMRSLEQGEGYIGAENRSNNSQYEYPYIMQAKDGTIHLVYAYKNRACIKWIALREEDIVGKIRGSRVYNPTSGNV